VEYLTAREWPRQAFWPYGGHLFCLHLVVAPGPGDAEVNPLGFQPLCSLTDGAKVVAGHAGPPQALRIGFELRSGAERAFL